MPIRQTVKKISCCLPFLCQNTKMKLLQRALNIWLEAGHTQTDFRRLTGIDTGTCSRIFTGERGLTIDLRSRIIRAFQENDSLSEALSIVVADLRDNIPPEAVNRIQITVHHPDDVSDKKRRKDRVSMAKADFQRDLDMDDPATIELVLCLYDWRQPKTKP
jgi:hypothetical protein